MVNEWSSDVVIMSCAVCFYKIMRTVGIVYSMLVYSSNLKVMHGEYSTLCSRENVEKEPYFLDLTAGHNNIVLI